MAFTVQNDTGTAQDANAYVSVEEFKSFQSDRGGNISAFTDDQIEKAIVRATDFLDARYSFVGEQWRLEQGTQFPRQLEDRPFKGYEKDPRTGLPRALKHATCLLAMRSLGGATLLPDPTYNPGGQVTSITKKVGPIETSTDFAEPVPGQAPAAPQYPDVDLLLKNAKLLGSSLSRRIMRG